MSFAPPVWLAVHEELRHGGADELSPRSCFDDFDDDALFRMFHLTRPCVGFISDSIGLRLRARTRSRRPGLSVDEMIMITLNYFAQGAMSVAVQERLGVSYSDCPDVICAVSKVIANMADQFISFPTTQDAKDSVALQIERLCGIPRVLGVVAAAHFRIRASPYEKDTFRSFLNTHGYTSVMTQITCDCDGNVLSADRCCVGSTAEQDIWTSSLLGRELEDGGHGQYWVIGGRGYNLSQHVLTAVSQPANDKEIYFNQAHAKIHDVMRTMLGSIKRRFKCLMQLGFAQETSLDKKGDIITACCILHNIAKKFSVPAPPVVGKIEALHPRKQHQMTPVEINPEALKARQELINDKFSIGSGSHDSPVTSNAV